MTKIHNNFDFVGGAKLTGLPSSTAAGEVVVHEQLAALSGGVTTATLAGDNNQPVTVASAATCDIGAAASQRVHITGTTTITSFGTSVGRLRFVTFAAALTLTHNATSLILPTGANITTAAGDSGVFMSDGTGNWTCLAYLRKSGKGVIPPVTADISGLDTYLAMLAAGGRFGALSQATAAADLNVVVDTGFHRLGAAHTNAPAVYSDGMLLVHRSGDVIKQVVTSYNGQSQYWRSGNPSDVGGAGSWGAWRQYVDSANVASFAPTYAPSVQTFSASGTWTKPATGTRVIVELWGGGGSGAKGSTAGGGGGGAYLRFEKPIAEFSATESVTIGAGGAAKAVGGTGNAGGNTSFGSHGTAYGGGGGGTTGGVGGGGGGVFGAGSSSNGAGGAGGSTSTNGGTGGDGSVPTLPTASDWGGGGGGGNGGGGTSAGARSLYGGGGGGGGAQAGGASQFGGAGGAAASGGGTAGAAKGGGGGSSNAGNSGAGGDGYCRVTVI